MPVHNLLSRASPQARVSFSHDCLHTSADGKDASSDNGAAKSPTGGRRSMMLQTMGHQLREMDTDKELSAQGPDVDRPTYSRGNRRGTIFMRNVHTGLDKSFNQKAHSARTPESDAVPGDDNDQENSGSTKSSNRYLWRRNEVDAGPFASSTVSFSFDDLIRWTQCYFDHWHAAYPFVDAPSMLDYFRRLAQNAVTDSDLDEDFHSTILRAMISISIHDNRQTGALMSPSPPTSLVFVSFGDAVSVAMQALLHEPSLLSLQAVLSVQLFLVSMLRYNAANRLEGLAVRVAYQLDLQRCPAQLEGLGHEESQIRQRVFWSLYLLDRQICPRLGLPLNINDNHIDVCYPGSERHEKSDSQLQQGRDARLDLLVFLAQNAKIRGCIMELRNTANPLNAKESDSKAVEINTSLTKWWNQVEEYLELSESAPITLSVFHRNILKLLRSESIIALNRSILANSTSPSAYNAALQNCIGAARSVINTIFSSLQSELPLLWHSFTWAAWMSAFIMVYAANEEQISKDAALRFVERAEAILRHLSLRGSSWPDACLVAIKGLKQELVQARNISETSERPGRGKRSSRETVESRTEQEAYTATMDGDDGRSRLAKRPRQDRQHQVSIQAVYNNKNTTQQTSALHKGAQHPAAGDLQSTGLSLGQQSYQPHIPPSSIMEGTTGYDDLNFQAWDTAVASSLSQMPIAGDLAHQFDIYKPSLDTAVGGGRLMNDLLNGNDIPFWMGDDQIAEFGL